jgi:hypothetical protein
MLEGFDLRYMQQLDGHVRRNKRIFSLEHAQLLTEGKDLEAKVVAGTEEGPKAGKKSKGKWNHGPEFIA